MNYFKEYGPSDNWEHSKGESVSEFLGVDMKTLDDGGFKVCQNVLISIPKNSDTYSPFECPQL